MLSSQGRLITQHRRKEKKIEKSPGCVTLCCFPSVQGRQLQWAPIPVCAPPSWSLWKMDTPVKQKLLFQHKQCHRDTTWECGFQGLQAPVISWWLRSLAKMFFSWGTAGCYAGCCAECIPHGTHPLGFVGRGTWLGRLVWLRKKQPFGTWMHLLGNSCTWKGFQQNAFSLVQNHSFWKKAAAFGK